MLINNVSVFEPGLFRPGVPMIALYEGQPVMNKHEGVLVSNTPSLIMDEGVLVSNTPSSIINEGVLETNTPSAYS